MGLLYTNMKVFHFKDKLDSLPREVSKVLPPINIRIKPTNVCNHSCNYCAYRAKGLQLGQDMVIKDYIPKEKMMEIIDDFTEMNVKAITFSGGGEPLCYKYILQTLKKIVRTKIRFACLTNGARLKGEIAEIFAKYGTWVRISTDGWDDKSYSTYRNVPEGEFEKVIKNLKNFKKIKGKCYLGMSIVVDKSNASHICELIMKLKDAGVDSVKVSPCIISNNGKENNEYHRLIFELVKKQIAEAKVKCKNLEIFDSYHTQLETFKKDYTWCPYLQILPVIGADLNIYPCHDKAYNLKEGLLGSIKEQRFKDFWFSDKNNFFKIDPSIHCNHHCVVHTKNKLILEYLEADEEHLSFV